MQNVLFNKTHCFSLENTRAVLVQMGTLMFLSPQSGLAGAEVSVMYHLLVNKKKASRWCWRICTLAFGGTADVTGVLVPVQGFFAVSKDLGC